MVNQYEAIEQLTAEVLPTDHLLRIVNDFTYSLGWHPSDWLHLPQFTQIANGHLLVEHGLENTAVISFLRKPHRYARLSWEEKVGLLGISYNNLVDWHICVESELATTVYNRKEMPYEVVNRFPLSRESVDSLRSEAFEQIAGKRPNPNFQALDDALISTISFWKRTLASVLKGKVSNHSFSALFNAIMFIRAIEDQSKRTGPQPSNETLSDMWNTSSDGSTLRGLIHSALGRLKSEIPAYLKDEDQLASFDGLDHSTVSTLLRDFYKSRFSPYTYDFSLMSKHALSRIYEHYVSILREENSAQLALFPTLPKEEKDRAFGSIYTPQFIARFFARYLQSELPPPVFRKLRVADPACGSGIFLRTLLELQCDTSNNGITTEYVQSTFKNILGIDVDPNACQATRLSLALLHLVLTDQLPPNLEILEDETVGFYSSNSAALAEKFDAVIANPPFVSSDRQAPEMKKRIKAFLGLLAGGKQDTAYAFLKIGVEMTRPGGYGLFVLPHSFLIADSARKMREFIAKKTWIRCLGDLSAIRVFPDSSSYIILLVFQRRDPAIGQTPPATILKCNAFAGKALQETLDGHTTENSFYSIYKVNQDTFKADDWVILPPAEAALRSRFDKLPSISEFLEVRQGFVSGRDDVFLLEKKLLPEGEQEAFVHYLPDRAIQRYTVPKTTNKYFFYPFENGEMIDEAGLKRRFKKTWAYLVENKDKLKKIPGRSKGSPWWSPARPRQPEHLLRPKIVTPHLVFVPRFALDAKGKYAVSRSPFLITRDRTGELELLKYFLAILNSTVCYWYISAHSHKYSRGYAMLEVKTLSGVPVPRPEEIDSKIMKRLLDLVDKRLKQEDAESRSIDRKLDMLVSNLYGLTEDEQRALGIGDANGD